MFRYERGWSTEKYCYSRGILEKGLPDTMCADDANKGSKELRLRAVLEKKQLVSLRYTRSSLNITTYTKNLYYERCRTVVAPVRNQLLSYYKQ